MCRMNSECLYRSSYDRTTYLHSPRNNRAAIGRTALRDFLCWCWYVAGMDGGLSFYRFGCYVADDLENHSRWLRMFISKTETYDGHMIVVVDLARNEWDWNRLGEPPADNPAYYLRYCKTFSRMGGECTTCRLITGIFYVSYSTCCPKPAPTDSAVCSSGASGLTF